MTQKVSRIAYMSLALSGLLLIGAGCASQTKLGMQANTETKEDGGAADAGSSDKNDANEKVATNTALNINVSTDGVKTNTKVSAVITDAKKESVMEIKMTAKDFAFVPGEVRVKLGQKVRLIVTSADVLHGIAIPAFNVHADLPVGVATTVEFTADQKGSFPFFCSVFCGSGHRGMKGMLIVE